MGPCLRGPTKLHLLYIHRGARKPPATCPPCPTLSTATGLSTPVCSQTPSLKVTALTIQMRQAQAGGTQGLAISYQRGPGAQLTCPQGGALSSLQEKEASLALPRTPVRPDPSWRGTARAPNFQTRHTGAHRGQTAGGQMLQKVLPGAVSGRSQRLESGKRGAERREPAARKGPGRTPAAVTAHPRCAGRHGLLTAPSGKVVFSHSMGERTGAEGPRGPRPPTPSPGQAGDGRPRNEQPARVSCAAGPATLSHSRASPRPQLCPPQGLLLTHVYPTRGNGMDTGGSGTSDGHPAHPVLSSRAPRRSPAHRGHTAALAPCRSPSSERGAPRHRDPLVLCLATPAPERGPSRSSVLCDKRRKVHAHSSVTAGTPLPTPTRSGGRAAPLLQGGIRQGKPGRAAGRRRTSSGRLLKKMPSWPFTPRWHQQVPVPLVEASLPTQSGHSSWAPSHASSLW